MKQYVLVSQDTETGQIDVWQCDEPGNKAVEKMPHAFEVATDAIKKPCVMLEANRGDADIFGFFVLDALRLHNHFELIKDGEQ